MNVNKGSYNADMKKKEAIKLAGSAYKLAKMLGVQRQAVSKWGDDVPPLRVYQLRELYPDVFGKRCKS